MPNKNLHPARRGRSCTKSSHSRSKKREFRQREGILVAGVPEHFVGSEKSPLRSIRAKRIERGFLSPGDQIYWFGGGGTLPGDRDV